MAPTAVNQGRAMPATVFVKIGDIKGESNDDRHREEIEVLSWSWGLAQSTPAAGGGGGGGAAGRTTFSDFTFTHVFDKSSPALMKACATGQHLREGTVAARKAGQGQQDYLIIKMSDVIVTSVQPTASGESAVPLETVSLRFGKVDLEYKSQRPDGSLDPGSRFAFDLVANRPL